MTVSAPEAPVVPLALPSRVYRSYALGLLMLIYVVNFVDRQVVTILAEPIKQDLRPRRLAARPDDRPGVRGASTRCSACPSPGWRSAATGR